MALSKNIDMENGIKTIYHRIVSLNKITNIANIIEVASYSSIEKREEEKQYQILQKMSAQEQELTEEQQSQLDKGINVFIETTFINKEYNETETIEQAYEYLKTTEKFKNATDI